MISDDVADQSGDAVAGSTEDVTIGASGEGFGGSRDVQPAEHQARTARTRIARQVAPTNDESCVRMERSSTMRAAGMPRPPLPFRTGQSFTCQCFQRDVPMIRPSGIWRASIIVAKVGSMS